MNVDEKTLRDWFAGIALANVDPYSPGDSSKYRNADTVARECYQVADAMLAESRRRESS